jgi:hypothetical protein
VKTKTKKEDPSSSHKCKKPKGGHKGAQKKNVPKPPPIANNISNKEKRRKLEKTISLEKPSHVMMACFKIEITYIFCKATNILCL